VKPAQVIVLMRLKEAMKPKRNIKLFVPNINPKLKKILITINITINAVIDDHSYFIYLFPGITLVIQLF